MSLADLERSFIQERVSGFPVVEGEDRLVGIVSRSDVVRQLCVEQSMAEMVSGFYQDLSGFQDGSQESLEEIAARIGTRIEHLSVRDVMVSDLVAVRPEDGLQEVAKRMLARRIHRVLVTEGERLRGIVSSLDLVRLFAEGRVQVD